MEREDGRTLTISAREERRKTIVRMRNDGKSYKDIQQATGACKAAVYWALKRFAEGGAAGVTEKHRGIKVGDNRRLTKEQEKSIQRKIIDKHPDQLKLDFALWTREAVRQLVLLETGIDLPIRTMGDYLKRWGFTPQKPTKFAY